MDLTLTIIYASWEMPAFCLYCHEHHFYFQPASPPFIHSNCQLCCMSEFKDSCTSQTHCCIWGGRQNSVTQQRMRVPRAVWDHISKFREAWTSWEDDCVSEEVAVQAWQKGLGSVPRTHIKGWTHGGTLSNLALRKQNQASHEVH